MSKFYIISEEEKNRILNLHNLGKKNSYLFEEINTSYDNNYDYWKDGERYFLRLKNTQDWKEATGKALIAIKTKVFNDPKIDTNSKKNDSPFESVEWGDHFRSWVNDNLPSIAKKYNLSRKGPHNNENIINTSNHVLTFKSGKTMKVIDYYKQKNPELIGLHLNLI